MDMQIQIKTDGCRFIDTYTFIDMNRYSLMNIWTDITRQTRRQTANCIQVEGQADGFGQKDIQCIQIQGYRYIDRDIDIYSSLYIWQVALYSPHTSLLSHSRSRSVSFSFACLFLFCFISPLHDLFQPCFSQISLSISVYSSTSLPIQSLSVYLLISISVFLFVSSSVHVPLPSPLFLHLILPGAPCVSKQCMNLL